MAYEGLADRIEGRDTVLLLCDESNFREVADRTTKQLLDEGRDGVFLTVDRSFREVEDDLEYLGADTEDLLYLDTVSSSRGITTGREDVVLVNSPTSYNDINLAVSDLMKELSEEGFVLLDSFTSYLVYDDLGSVGDFVHRIFDKVSDSGRMFLMTAVKSQMEDEALERCREICGRSIDLTE
ncbi:MAG: hypothetical protein SVQ76_01775 [Candidatus Nanohaloarchaea archaeon]|nr:hypothetical protein [Candidatus Nanohaloarchaea archaeon]